MILVLELTSLIVFLAEQTMSIESSKRVSLMISDTLFCCCSSLNLSLLFICSLSLLISLNQLTSAFGLALTSAVSLVTSCSLTLNSFGSSFKNLGPNRTFNLDWVKASPSGFLILAV